MTDGGAAKFNRFTAFEQKAYKTLFYSVATEHYHQSYSLSYYKKACDLLLLLYNKIRSRYFSFSGIDKLCNPIEYRLI